jgi:hypothetical protein
MTLDNIQTKCRGETYEEAEKRNEYFKELGRNEVKKELKDLQEAYGLAMNEINKLRAKRKYWEMKFKNLEEAKI